MKIDTLAVHAGRPHPRDARPVNAGIMMSTVYQREADGGHPGGYLYTREANPNRTELEQALAVIEGGKDAAAFSSGSAATAALFQSLRPGDHVICTEGYYGTIEMLRNVFGPWGLEFTLMDTGDVEAVRSARRKNTRMFWIETPSNPMMRISDLRALTELAHASGAVCAVDSTFGTPVLQRPLELGADFVMHSSTKYLGGHTDVLGGAIVAREDSPMFERVRQIQHELGGVPSPFDCWLIRRGMRTLALRVERQSANAAAIAPFLAKHPKVEAALYPGLATHPNHQIAARQMRAFGGMVSLLVKGGKESALQLASSFKIIKHTTSLGGVETIVDHRATVEPEDTPTPQNLLRLSCGIEACEDLLEDLRQGLDQL